MESNENTLIKVRQKTKSDVKDTTSIIEGCIKKSIEKHEL